MLGIRRHHVTVSRSVWVTLLGVVLVAPLNSVAEAPYGKLAPGTINYSETSGVHAEICRDHLFDPFYSGRLAGRGRGFGLPTAWRLAREHGGDVRFDRPVEGPTRFILSLPRDSSNADQPAENCDVQNAPEFSERCQLSSVLPDSAKGPDALRQAG